MPRKALTLALTLASPGPAFLLPMPMARAQPTYVVLSCVHEDLQGALRERWRQGRFAGDEERFRVFPKSEEFAADAAEKGAAAGASAAYLLGDERELRARLAAYLGRPSGALASGAGHVEFSGEDLARLWPKQLLMLADLTRDMRAQTLAVEKFSANPKREPSIHGKNKKAPAFERAQWYIRGHLPYFVERARLAALRGDIEGLRMTRDDLAGLGTRFDEELRNYKQLTIRLQGKVPPPLASFERIWRAILNSAHGEVALFLGFVENDEEDFERAARYLDAALKTVDADCTPLLRGKILLLKGRALLEAALGEFANLQESWPSPDGTSASGNLLTGEEVDNVRAIIERIKTAGKTVTAGINETPFHQRAIDWARGFLLLKRTYLAKGRIIRETEALLKHRGDESIFRFERPYQNLLKYTREMIVQVFGEVEDADSGFSAISGFRRSHLGGKKHSGYN